MKKKCDGYVVTDCCDYHYRLQTQAPFLLRACIGLLKWADMMGGWEAREWKKIKVIVDGIEIESKEPC